MIKLRNLMLIPAICLLFACGGDGGSDSSDPVETLTTNDQSIVEETSSTASTNAPEVEESLTSTPDTNIPTVSDPVVVDDPVISTPTVNDPPTISTPTISTPTISTPTISTPTISTPTISTPAISDPVVVDPPASGNVTILDNDQSSSPEDTVFYGYSKNIGANDNPAAAPYGGIARYVDPLNGANNGSGSINQPWADLEYAMKNCRAGDTIYLRGGVHYYDILINNNVPATQNNPVEVRSYPGEWAIIDGSNTSNGNLFRMYYESWIILRNFEIRYSDDSRVSAGLALEGSKDCEFHNLYIHDNHGSGVAGAIGTERLKFYNLTVTNNYDVNSGGENADGFSFTAGLNHEFYRCVSEHNSDDGWDLWSSTGHYFEDCIAHTNGYGTAGDGNGFKLGKVASSSPQAGSGGGNHELVGCLAVKNKTRGFDENGSTVASSFDYCIAYNTGMNWKIPNSRHIVSHGVSFAGTGDSIGSSSIVSASQGQGFGGVVTASDFESVDLADMNNTTNGRRFFVPVSQSFWGTAP